MNIGNQWKYAVAVVILILGVSISCTRSISVPVNPQIAQNNFTSTSTGTPTNTGTPTSSITNTATSTATSTATLTITPTPNGPTATPTNTGTNTATATITNTPTSTGTPTITNTPAPPTATPTPSNTPTVTFTSTPTPTATINPNMIDDFESDTANIDPGPGGTGPVSWNGSWFTVTDGSVSIYPDPTTWIDAAPGDGSSYAAHVTISGSVTQNASFGFNFVNPQTASSEINLQTGGYTGFVFDIKADAAYPAIGNFITVEVPDSDTSSAGGVCSACSDYHSAKVCLSTSWTPVTVFFSQLSQVGWGVPQVAFKPQSIYGMSFAFPVSQNAGGMGVWVDNVQLTTAAPPAGLGANYISDFDFNLGGTSVNPNLTNYPAAGAKGFQTTNDAATNTVMSPFIICGSGDASNYSAALNSTWTDLANSVYPSGQLQVFLMPTPSGGVTTYYHLPTGLTGIRFNWNVLTNTSTAASPAGIFLHYNNAYIDGTSQYGICTGGCWDDYVAPALPNTGGAGWSLQSVPFSSFTQGYPSTTSPADPCEPGGGASGAVFPYAGGCYNNTTIGFSWSAQSGNVAGNYDTYFEVDNVTFY